MSKHATRPSAKREPVFPARGHGYLVPCPRCQEVDLLTSVPDVGMIDRRYPVGSKRRERGGLPLGVSKLKRGSVRKCAVCGGRGALPRDSLLDPYELP